MTKRFQWMFLLLLASPAAFAAPATDQAVELLCEKRIALLGELPSHGEARAFAGKAAIVRALVERCGYDAVLFEAPLYDFVGLETALATGRATGEQLDDAIGKFWWARELTEFRAWLLRASAERGLRIGGIDDQVSATSNWARERLPAMVARNTAPEDRESCTASVGRLVNWSYDDEHAFDDAEKHLLGRCASAAAAASTEAPGEDAFLLANFDSLVQRQIEAMSAIDRDAVMSRNVLWYLHRLPADSKVVVWTASVHASKRSGDLSAKPMGTWLAESQGDALGSIAFTALGGRSSRAGKPSEALPTLAAGSLEAKALAGGKAEAFLPAPALQKLGSVQSRLYGPFVSTDWATRFDGVVVYREEKAPTFGQ